MAEKEISRATLKRLPTYLSYLKSISGDEQERKADHAYVPAGGILPPQ